MNFRTPTLSAAVPDEFGLRRGGFSWGKFRGLVYLAWLVVLPRVAHGNPVMIDGESLLAFAIVAFWALVIESSIVMLALLPCGLLFLPTFISLAAANGALFLFGFLPLTGRMALGALEFGVILGDAVLIKLVTAAPFLQGGGFLGVSWRRALLASLLGNAASFFVGWLASGTPWVVHGQGA